MSIASVPRSKRPTRHLSPRYVYDKLRVKLYEYRNPGSPWLTRDAIEILERTLSKDALMLEWGSGRSTAWFSERTGQVISVESHRGWYENVTRQLAEAGCDNVTYHLHEDQDEPETDRAEIPYVDVAASLSDDSVDVVLVDGIFRGKCAVAAVSKVRPGGLLVVDNVNWYLPSDTKAPASIAASAPPRSADWASFADAVSEWECRWTSNGVSDTALWTKPTA